ncbi:hypothetical protein GCM10011403_19090 [Pseudohongiella nitratireducens]|uniref:Uncharacterized protein n=1 Tax=Pseudohongiella nitratireducens TaxID=1768907 RepID=A0A916VJL1_9GAMM|nr:hypothetical protein GCM10011403_19090 [Pseudohongiella nitratireducens]
MGNIESHYIAPKYSYYLAFFETTLALRLMQRKPLSSPKVTPAPTTHLERSNNVLTEDKLQYFVTTIQNNECAHILIYTQVIIFISNNPFFRVSHWTHD